MGTRGFPRPASLVPNTSTSYRWPLRELVRYPVKYSTLASTCPVNGTRFPTTVLPCWDGFANVPHSEHRMSSDVASTKEVTTQRRFIQVPTEPNLSQFVLPPGQTGKGRSQEKTPLQRLEFFL